tara:strand:- start:514 stop:1275 length:762 start_codon:yes stop_codon:yes gene_type:complete
MFFSKKLIKYKNIYHCFFSKKNGFSKGIYKSLNCGPGSNDDKENITKNLNFVTKKIGIKSESLILMNQTHSNKVILINENNKKDKIFNSDAIITNLKNIALGVLTADCVPIILYDEKNQVVGCIHSGWKGGISGVIENTINKFKEMNSEVKIIASVGPCIEKESYEVGKDFFEDFLKESENNKNYFERLSELKFLFNIRGYVNNKLKECGVSEIDNVKGNTFNDSDNFFSYRRAKKLGKPDYGRCISTICLKT